MKKGIVGLLACISLLFAGAAMAGPVEVNGGLNITGTPGTDAVTFPDGTKQTTAGVTSVQSGGGLTITGGNISISTSGVSDSMLSTGISGSKIINGSISQSQIAPIKAPVLNAGQQITYATGDDGNFKYGAVVIGSRFTDNGNGTVTDNLTSLIWLQNANCIGAQTWANALAQANGLANGACGGGLTDGSAAGDWRLPNRNELKALIDYSKHSPALPAGNPFTNVQSNYYWSSSTYAPNTAFAWGVNMNDGPVGSGFFKSASYYVWPVRGGQ